MSFVTLLDFAELKFGVETFGQETVFKIIVSDESGDNIATTLATQATLDAVRQLLAGNLTVTDANSASVQGVEALTIGNNGTPRRSVGCNCTAEGNATFVLADNSTITLPLYIGWQTFPFAVKQVSAFTGTGTFYNLK